MNREETERALLSVLTSHSPEARLHLWEDQDDQGTPLWARAAAYCMTALAYEHALSTGYKKSGEDCERYVQHLSRTRFGKDAAARYFANGRIVVWTWDLPAGPRRLGFERAGLPDSAPAGTIPAPLWRQLSKEEVEVACMAPTLAERAESYCPTHRAPMDECLCPTMQQAFAEKGDLDTARQVRDFDWASGVPPKPDVSVMDQAQLDQAKANMQGMLEGLKKPRVAFCPCGAEIPVGADQLCERCRVRAGTEVCDLCNEPATMDDPLVQHDRDHRVHRSCAKDPDLSTPPELHVECPTCSGPGESVHHAAPVCTPAPPSAPCPICDGRLTCSASAGCGGARTLAAYEANERERKEQAARARAEREDYARRRQQEQEERARVAARIEKYEPGPGVEVGAGGLFPSVPQEPQGDHAPEPLGSTSEASARSEGDASSSSSGASAAPTPSDAEVREALDHAELAENLGAPDAEQVRAHAEELCDNAALPFSKLEQGRAFRFASAGESTVLFKATPTTAREYFGPTIHFVNDLTRLVVRVDMGATPPAEVPPPPSGPSVIQPKAPEPAREGYAWQLYERGDLRPFSEGVMFCALCSFAIPRNELAWRKESSLSPHGELWGHDECVYREVKDSITEDEIQLFDQRREELRAQQAAKGCACGHDEAAHSEEGSACNACPCVRYRAGEQVALVDDALLEEADAEQALAWAKGCDLEAVHKQKKAKTWRACEVCGKPVTHRQAYYTHPGRTSKERGHTDCVDQLLAKENSSGV